MEIHTTKGSAGSLDGFRVTCPKCGLRMSSTIRSNLELDVAAHLAYHAKKEAK